MTVLTFEWDEEKSRNNRAKHGFSFEEAKAVFYDACLTERIDTRFEYGEVLMITTGMMARGVLLVVSTRREKNIRIISARRATRKETDDYFANSR